MEKLYLFVAGHKRNQIMVIEARVRIAIMAVQSLETRMRNSASIARKTLMSYECIKLKNKEKRASIYRPKGKSNDEGNVSVATDGNSDGNEVLVAFAGCANSGDEWILDSAASFHICINRDWFITYDSVSGGSVKMGDDSPYQIVGIGSVQIKMHDGIIRTLTDVRHILDMRKNLISLSTLDGKGYKYSGGDGVLNVSKGSLIVMKADLKSANLYRLRGTTITGDAAIISNSLSNSDATNL
ncbi:hypothetical protein C2845_PM08G11360 [Panicum miliaceum]|uniref:Retrovirus-related Pol polyprotein from transposon TNT 1-94-like beta-barrel domain-containing protein n=1 Tax=Panicum miliaceum TaxID=4540 RepID=A0A3L6QVS2_PANMI|nr:hypothetical protein C2845_PM08G11360 [Panicum miliaceum]